MNRQNLLDAICKFDLLKEHADFLLGIARPSVSLQMVDHSNSPLADESRFGGKPFVPQGFE